VKVEKITSGATKLAILKAQLKSRAAEVIEGVALTDANFDPTWALLLNRFEDKRELIHAYVEKFYEFPNLISESGLGLQGLLNIINNTVLALSNIKVDVSKSDVFIVHIAVRKLDSKTRTWWALSP